MKEEKNYKYPFGFFHVLGGIIVGVLVACVFAIVIGALIMVLWNWLMPDIFGFGVITYWQGFGIALLARLLFGGIGHKGKQDKSDHMCPPKHRPRMNHGAKRNRWFDDMYEDWWETEGAKNFDAYMKREAEKEQEDD